MEGEKPGSNILQGNGQFLGFRTGENGYRISVAVVGFTDADLSIEAKENRLAIRGEKQTNDEEKAGEVLYQGIAARTFERSFQLADYVEVKGASLENGLLHVDLVREIPEADEHPPHRHPSRPAHGAAPVARLHQHHREHDGHRSPGLPQRPKRWRDAEMALRWTAAGMREAAKGFRRLKATRSCPSCGRPWLPGMPPNITLEQQTEAA